MKVTASFPKILPVRSRLPALIAAAMVTLMLLAQLYSYDTLASVLAVTLSYTDQPLVEATAGVLVVVELFSLPFLLAMNLSRLMRIVSGICAIGIAFFWLFLVFTSSHAQNVGIFGSAIEVPGGIAAAVWCMILAGCVGAAILAVQRAQRGATS